MKTKTSPYERIVFCDFDGTITANETFVGMLKQFATQNYADVESLVMQGKISLPEGIRRLVESIPSERLADMQDYIRKQEIRPGFEKLLDFLDEIKVPLVVISGGLIEQVQTRLEPYRKRILNMHAARLDTTSEYLRVRSDHETRNELVSKKALMDGYNYKLAAAIGDGVTDISMAARADIVFARDNLCRYLDQEKTPYRRWQTFFDIRDALARRWN